MIFSMYLQKKVGLCLGHTMALIRQCMHLISFNPHEMHISLLLFFIVIYLLVHTLHLR